MEVVPVDLQLAKVFGRDFLADWITATV